MIGSGKDAKAAESYAETFLPVQFVGMSAASWIRKEPSHVMS